MRLPIALGMVVLLAACQSAVPPSSEVGPEVARSVVASKRLLQGTLSAPAGLVGLDSATLVGLDAASLVGLDSASLVGLDSATLAGPATLGSVRRLQSLASAPVAGVTVVLAWPNGTPVEPRVEAVTDAQGRFSFSVRGERYIAVALLQDAAKAPVRLRGFSDARDARAHLHVSLASTMVVTGLLAEGEERGLAQMPVAAYERVLKTAEDALPEASLPAGLGDVEVLRGYQQLVESNQAVFEAVEAVRPVLQGPQAWFDALERGEDIASLTASVGGATDDEEVVVPASETRVGIAPTGELEAPDAVAIPPQAPVVLPTASAVLPPTVTEIPLATPVVVASPVNPPVEMGVPAVEMGVPGAVKPVPTPTLAPVVSTIKSEFQLKGNLASDSGCFTWSNPNIEVKPGDKVVVTASGTVKLWRWGLKLGPTGHPLWVAPAIDLAGCENPLPGKPSGMLVYKLGVAGEVAPVGDKRSFVVDKAGKLRFAVNDSWASDNTGQFDIKVVITRTE